MGFWIVAGLVLAVILRRYVLAPTRRSGATGDVRIVRPGEGQL
jgi:hypothetical protein